MTKKVNQLKAGAVITYIQRALSVVIGLVYTPLMIRILGKSEYGLYNTVSSAISMLSILSLGFTSGYIYCYTKYKKNEDEDGIARLNGEYMLIFTVIGLVALVCGMYFTNHMELLFRDGISPDEHLTAQILMFLLTLNLAASFPMSIFQSIISAHEQFVFLKTLGAIKTVLGPLVTLPLLLMGFRSIAMVVVTVTVSALVDITYYIYIKKALHCRFIFHGFEKGLFKTIFTYSIFIALHLIADQINMNVDNILLTRYRGTEAAGVYSVGYQLSTYYSAIALPISAVFVPRVFRIINDTKDNLSVQRTEMTGLFIRVGRIQYLILGLIASGLIFFGRTFIRFWAGEGFEEAYAVALLLILPLTIDLIQHLGIEIQRAENLHAFRACAYIIMAVLNFAVSRVLCQKFGPIGAATGTAIAYLVCQGLVINLYYQKKCNLDIPAFWKSIGRMTVGMIPPVVIGVVLTRIFAFDTKITLVVGIAVYTLIYAASMWLIGMNDYEKTLIKTLPRLIKRK